MDSYQILIVLICISTLFAYINTKILKIPFVIGLFVLSSCFSLLVILTKLWFPAPFVGLKLLVEQTNISKFILDTMLGLLLFAGSLHTDWEHIKSQLKPIGIFAIGGVIISTIIIALMFFGITQVFNLHIDFIYCLVFGALISPTDPIAVLGILTKVNAPKRLETIIVGESLFNDGVGVVMFISLIEILNSGSNHFSFTNFGILFFQEAIGGIIFGLLVGLILHKVLKSIDHFETEVLLTIAFVMGGYALANILHLSGALAMVILGLMVGNYKKSSTMSENTIDYVHKFWELIDVILNAILFSLIAFVMIEIDFQSIYILVGIISIFLVLISRIFVIYLPSKILPNSINLNLKEVKIIVWGGLRGGLSLALVLSLPNSQAKPLLLICTYFCVLFSIIIQGLSIERLAK